MKICLAVSRVEVPRARADGDAVPRLQKEDATIYTKFGLTPNGFRRRFYPNGWKKPLVSPNEIGIASVRKDFGSEPVVRWSRNPRNSQHIANRDKIDGRVAYAVELPPYC